MDSIDISYFLWCNLPIIVCMASCWYWNKIRNEEIQIERKRIILENQMEKESMAMALQKYERESNRFNEVERQLREIIKRMEQDSLELSVRTKKSLKEIEEERRYLRNQRQEYEYKFDRQQLAQSSRYKNEADFQQIFDNTCKFLNIFGGLAMALVLGKAVLK